MFDDPHWFWCDQYDSQVQMAGVAATWDRIVVRGSIEDRSFCAFLLDADGIVRSTVSLDWKRDVRRSFGLISAQASPDPAALADPEVDLRTLVPAEGTEPCISADPPSDIPPETWIFNAASVRRGAIAWRRRWREPGAGAPCSTACSGVSPASGRSPVELDPEAVVDRGDDVWKSLRI